MEMIKERLKSKVVWLAVLAQILLVVTMYQPELAVEIKTVATAAIEIATLLGVLNNPADRDNF